MLHHCRPCEQIILRSWRLPLPASCTGFGSSSGCGAAIGQIGDVEAVIVLAPFAFAQHGLRNLLDGEVGEGVEIGAERLAANQQACALRRLLRKLPKLLVREALRGDVDEVGLGGTAVHPVVLFARAHR